MSDIQTLLQQAHTSAGSGHTDVSKQLLEQVLDLDSNQADALGMLGQLSLSQNDLKQAVHYLDRLNAVMPNNPWVYFDLGQAYEMGGELEQAATAYLKAWKTNPDNARFSLYSGAAYHALGKHEQALQIWSLGADRDHMVRAAHQHPKADEQTKGKSRLADQMLRKHFTTQHERSLEKCKNPERLQTSLWPQTHNGPVVFENDQLKPLVFYAPNLPQTSVFSNPDEDWVEELQNSSQNIRDEYLAFMKTQSGPSTPYLGANVVVDPSCEHLKEQQNWTAVHLFKDGIAQPCIEHFPKTRAAFKNVPVVIFNGHPMEIFFSVLKPNIHIPPHFGTANTRLTSHLPLIIPSDKCRIRVADQTHHWKEGELFLFDDGWNHEAWNDSDETRVVLIFEAWPPDLLPEEIKAIQTSFEDRDAWLKSRKVPEIETI